MLRIIVVISLLGAFQYQICRGEQTADWQTQGFYRPRRNHPSLSQNEHAVHAFQANHGQNSRSQANHDQNSQSQNAVRSEFSQSFTIYKQNESPFGINYQSTQKQSLIGSNSQPQYSFRSGNQNSVTSDTSRTNFGQNYNQNVFGTSNQNKPTPYSFGTIYTQKAGSQNALGSSGQNSFARFNQNPQGTNNGQNSFGSISSQLHHNMAKTSIQPLFGSNSQNTQTQNYFNNQKSQNAFGITGQNIPTQSAFGLQSQNAFSTLGSNSGFAKGHNYRGPDYLPPKRFMAPEYLPPKYPTTSTTTRRPFYTTTKRPIYTTTRRTFYTTTTTKRPISTTTTRRTSYTTTTTKRPFYTTTITGRPFTLPASMAIRVEPEPDDDEEIIDDFTTTTKQPVAVAAPAMAMPVPPEEDDPTLSMTSSSTPSTTTLSTPSTTSSTTTTPEPDDDEEIIEDFTTTTKQPVAVPAPAMAMPVPPEEDDPTLSMTSSSIPSTTTSTTPSTTSSTTTTSPSTTISTTPSTTTSTTTITTTTPPPTTTSTTPSTTTSTTPSTTTSTTPSTTTSTTTTTTTTPQPTTTSTTPSTTTSTTPSTTSTTSTTTPDPNRYLIEEGSSPYTPPPVTSTPSTTTFIAPGDPVPPEPECDPLDPSTYPSEFDQRYFGNSSPCAPITTTTVKSPYKGPLYLPPPDESLCVPQTRVRRSTEDTLRLADLPGTPRPVWYAGIYKKVTDPYYPICGGSIVREDIVISAAHCFWDDVGGKQPADLFAVAVNKIYKPWKDPMDKKAQKSDVLDITIPRRYLGAKASFQEDIAILKLATPFKYTRGVRPICVDFDVGFDRQQLKGGHYGTIAGWGYTDSKGTPTQRLLWLELPYIEIENCIRDSEESFLKYITSDKVCAGENDTGKALCRGDSGGGLAFWQGPASHATPYLRGVASTAPTDKNAACNVFAYGSFTWLYAHRTFLRDHVPDIETCRFWE